MATKKFRFYVEIEVDSGNGPYAPEVRAIAVKHALDDAESHGRLDNAGPGFVQDVSVWPMKRRPRSATG